MHLSALSVNEVQPPHEDVASSSGLTFDKRKLCASLLCLMCQGSGQPRARHPQHHAADQALLRAAPRSCPRCRPPHLQARQRLQRRTPPSAAWEAGKSGERKQACVSGIRRTRSAPYLACLERARALTFEYSSATTRSWDSSSSITRSRSSAVKSCRPIVCSASAPALSAAAAASSSSSLARRCAASSVRTSSTHCRKKSSSSVRRCGTRRVSKRAPRAKATPRKQRGLRR